MPKKSIYAILVIVCVIGAAILWQISLAHPKSGLASTNTQELPSQFSQVTVGMKETQVAALLGPAPDKSIYPKFEHKTPAQWAQLQQQVEAKDSSASADNASPNNMAIIKAQVQLTHRYHDVWKYQPVPNTFMTLYFDEGGSLLKIGFDKVIPKH